MGINKNTYEYIMIHFINGEEVHIKGIYLGHTRPDGKVTKNWHYYLDDDGVVYHIPKDKILYIESEKGE